MGRKIITLCGSTKFKDEFLKVQDILILDGWAVMSVNRFTHADHEEVSDEELKLLELIHYQKIDMADAIIVINVDGYIGENTKKEIEYAKKNGKTVLYYTDCFSINSISLVKSFSSRPSKDEYYYNIALDISKRSTCLRRQYGAVIVKDDRIIATGYNGSAKGEPNCCDEGVCWRETNGIPHGQQYEKCKAVHAEANAISQGNASDMRGATLYLAGFENGKEIEDARPCEMCARLIKNAGIDRVVNKNYSPDCGAVDPL